MMSLIFLIAFIFSTNSKEEFCNTQYCVSNSRWVPTCEPIRYQYLGNLCNGIYFCNKIALSGGYNCTSGVVSYGPYPWQQSYFVAGMATNSDNPTRIMYRSSKWCWQLQHDQYSEAGEYGVNCFFNSEGGPYEDLRKRSDELEFVPKSSAAKISREENIEVQVPMNGSTGMPGQMCCGASFCQMCQSGQCCSSGNCGSCTTRVPTAPTKYPTNVPTKTPSTPPTTEDGCDPACDVANYGNCYGGCSAMYWNCAQQGMNHTQPLILDPGSIYRCCWDPCNYRKCPHQCCNNVGAALNLPNIQNC